MKRLLIIAFALSILAPFSFADDKDKDTSTAAAAQTSVADPAPKAESTSEKVTMPTKAETPPQVKKTVAITETIRRDSTE